LADVVVETPPGTSFWPSTMHEPLILGLTLHFAAVSLWIVRGHPRVLELVRSLREVWPSVPGSERDIQVRTPVCTGGPVILFGMGLVTSLICWTTSIAMWQLMMMALTGNLRRLWPALRWLGMGITS
jgi:hypothetical protein